MSVCCTKLPYNTQLFDRVSWEGDHTAQSFNRLLSYSMNQKYTHFSIFHLQSFYFNCSVYECGTGKEQGLFKQLRKNAKMPSYQVTEINFTQWD